MAALDAMGLPQTLQPGVLLIEWTRSKFGQFWQIDNRRYHSCESGGAMSMTRDMVAPILSTVVACPRR